jgi:hypothetical protein
VNSTLYINDFNANEKAQLLVQIGEGNLSFSILQSNTFTALAAYNYNDVNDISDILQTEPLLQSSFSKVDVVYTNKQCLLIPPVFFTANNKEKHIELVYGKTIDEEYKSDFLFRHNIHTVYTIKKALQHIISSKFLFANNHHLYSLLPDVARLKGNKLFITFYEKRLILLVCVENNLQLIQQFEYATPEDAVYYLLAAVQAHHLLIEDTGLEVGGTIDQNSNLHAELHKYFKHINFMHLNDTFSCSTSIKEMPAHYFSPLLNVAACV